MTGLKNERKKELKVPERAFQRTARKVSWSLGGYNGQKIMKSLRNQGHSAAKELTNLLLGLLITELN